MSNPILYQVGWLLLLLVISFGVYKVRGRWNAWHLVFVILLYLLTVGFMIFAAASLKTRVTWLKEFDEKQKQLEDAQDKAGRLMAGDLTQVAQRDDNVRRTRAQLERTMADRGRAWRECTPQGIADNMITLSTLRPGLDAAAAAPNGILAKDVLYAFKEIDVDGLRVPAVYLGEFSVEDRTDQTVKLKPVLPLDVVQQSHINAGGATWSLYEIIPVDSHAAFADDPDLVVDLEQNEPLFGAWDPAKLGRYFGPSRQGYVEMMADTVTPELYDRLLQQEYLRDGMVLTEEEVRAGGAELAANTWVKVRFIKPWKLAVDELNGNAQSALNGGYFDATGRAVVDYLRRREGEDIEFKNGDLAVFDGEKARGLIGQGLCEQVAPFFVRPLVDFDHAFHQSFVKLAKLATTQGELQANLAALTGANDRSKLQIAFRQDERAKLLQEKTLFVAERDAMATYQQNLARQVQSMKDELNAIARQNAELAAELTRLQSEAGVAANN